MKTDSKRILLASGGTGGHIFPALALGKDLENHGFKVFYSFDERSKSYVDLSAENISVIKITNNNKPGLLAKIQYLIMLLLAIINSMRVVNKIKPDLVIGFGGYATFPVLFAALMFNRTKIMIHESNRVMGKANEFFISAADIIAGGFEEIETIPNKLKNKFVYTGTPVREAIAKLNKPSGNKKSKYTNIFIFGGSQAAKKFSELIPPAIALLDKTLQKKLNIIQQCKADEIEQIKKFYDKLGISSEIQSFFTDIELKYAIADLVIARAGASTIAELIELNLPSILIPLPGSAKNHQVKNADFLAQKKGCLMAEEKGLTPIILAQKIEYILTNRNDFLANLAHLHKKSSSLIIPIIKKLLNA